MLRRLLILLVALLPSCQPAFAQTNFVVDETSTTTVAEDKVGPARMSSNKILYVQPANGSGSALFPSAFSSADNIAAQTATAMHGLLLAWDAAGGNWDRLRLDASGNLNVNINANSFGTMTTDVSDRAGRLLGVVYGSQGQQLKQTPTNFNAQVEIAVGGTLVDPRAIRALTSGDVVSVNNAFLLDATYIGRMPAGASPADGESNTNTALSRIGGYNYIFNSVNWDRWTGAVTQGGAPWSNNITQLGGTAIDTNSGNKSAGTQRVVLATDQPNLTTPLNISGSVSCSNCSGSGASAVDKAAFSEGVSAFAPAGGVYNPTLAPLSSGTQAEQAMTANRAGHVNLRDATGTEIQLTQLLVQLNTQLAQLNKSQNAKLIGSLGRPIGADGDRLRVSVPAAADPCANNRKQDAAISQTATTAIVTGVPGQGIYVCMIRVVVGAAEIVSEWEGTSTKLGGSAACASSTVAHSGSTTAANGESFAVNGGFTSGDGTASVVTIGPGKDFCIAQSGASRVSGTVSYVIAP